MRPRRWSWMHTWRSVAGAITILLFGCALGMRHMPGPLAFTPDGRSLVGVVNGYPWPAIRDGGPVLYGVVKVWDATTGQERARLSGPTAWLRALAVAPDGATLAVAGDFPAIELWDLHLRSRRSVLEGHTGRVYNVLFSPDGATLASANWDGEVWLWDTATGLPRLRLRVDKYGADSLAFSRDGAKLAASDSHGVRIWDVRDGHLLKEIPGERVDLLGFGGADELRLVRYSGHHGEGAAILDEDADCTRFEVHRPSHSGAVLIAPDGRRLASADRRGGLTIRDASAGDMLITLGGDSQMGHPAAFSPGGEFLAAYEGSAYNDSGQVAVWDTRDATRVSQFDVGDPLMRWSPPAVAGLAWLWATVRLRRGRQRAPGHRAEKSRGVDPDLL